MSNLVKMFAQNYIKSKEIKDLETQKWLILFADEIDKMLGEAMIKEKKDEQKN